MAKEIDIENGEAVYKMPVPLTFYAKAAIPLAIALGLFLAKVDYKIIILGGLGGVFLTINNSYFIIEVYEDYFAIILPSVWFDKYLKVERKFYYDFVSDYDCDIGGLGMGANQKEKAMAELTSMVMSRHSGMGNGKFSQINFTYKEKGEEKRIQRWYSAQQTKNLTEADKQIKARLKQGR